MDADSNHSLPLDRLEGLISLARYAQVGRCVNGVAHDINNMLGAIMAYSELVALEENLDAEPLRMLQEITASATKCSELVSAITTVARREAAHPVMTDLAKMVEHVVLIRSYACRVGQIEVETDIAGGIPNVVIDMAAVQMAVIHLVANAEEALEEQTIRQLRISLAAVDGGIQIAVWNSGPPIEPDLRVRMFEPGFTTKKPPHMGLGLATARRVVEQHGGRLCYDAEQGFVMRIPMDGEVAIGGKL